MLTNSPMRRARRLIGRTQRRGGADAPATSGRPGSAGAGAGCRLRSAPEDGTGPARARPRIDLLTDAVRLGDDAYLPLGEQPLALTAPVDPSESALLLVGRTGRTLCFVKWISLV